jgi:hypothetical protein
MVHFLRGVGNGRRAEERSDFVGRACGGVAQLHREVKELLQAHQSAGTFFNASPASDPTNRSPGFGLERERVVDYELPAEIGRGGMGAVYRPGQ